MKKLSLLFFLIISINLFSQKVKLEDFGCEHFVMMYENDSVDILVKKKNGDELKAKPIFLFCQGSLPIPLAIYDSLGKFPVFPFNADSICEKYHLVIISKPFIPLFCNTNSLDKNNCYVDSSGKFPVEYMKRNYLSYYVNRNIEVLKFLLNKKWVNKNQVIVAGHSEGSSIAAKMAINYPKITHLIFAGGNPYGRIMAMIQKDRKVETDSTKDATAEFKYWKYVIENKNNTDNSNGDSPKNTYEFSEPLNIGLLKLKIPVLICYGTKDIEHAPFNDLFRVEAIRNNNKNIDFKDYIGLEHNFFPLNEKGEPDWNIYNWDKVGNDWLNWLKSK